jgi:hypothetical protein
MFVQPQLDRRDTPPALDLKVENAIQINPSWEHDQKSPANWYHVGE